MRRTGFSVLALLFLVAAMGILLSASLPYALGWLESRAVPSEPAVPEVPAVPSVPSVPADSLIDAGPDSVLLSGVS